MFQVPPISIDVINKVRAFTTVSLFLFARSGKVINTSFLKLKRNKKMALINDTYRGKFILPVIVLALSASAVRAGQQLDGIWVGTEKLTPSSQTNCPKQNSQQSMSAKIIVAQGGSLLAVANGYGPGRYVNLHLSGNTLIFQVSNMRKGELRLSSDGKTLSEKGYLRRTIDFGMRMGGTGNVLMDNSGPVGAVNGLHGSKATHVAVPTPCVDEVTGIFHREK